VYKTKIYSSGDPNYAKVDKKIKFYPFYVTRMDNCPSVLVETGFLTNPTEGNLLSQDNTQYWLASGIFNGIEAYFNSNH
jgi:N-acetylmuramoyl-L-alanine amidase